jgi:hypothetical protein
MNITLLVGLPASGKTWLGHKLTKDIGLFIDDPKDLKWINNISNEEHLVIADSHFCKPKVIEKCIEVLETKLGKIEYEIIYFENDPVSCKVNVEYRNDKRKVNEFIDLLSKVYIIPENSKVKRVYQRK